MDAEGTTGPVPFDTPLTVSVRKMGRVQVIALRGAVRLDEADELKGQLLALVEEGPAHLVFDLSELEFLSSMGISALIAARNAVGKAGGGACIVQPPRPVLELLELTRVVRLIPVHASLEAALEAITAAPN